MPPRADLKRELDRARRTSLPLEGFRAGQGGDDSIDVSFSGMKNWRERGQHGRL